MSEVSTRAKSVKKPADHKPASVELVPVEFAGAKFEVPAGVVTSARLLRDLEKNMFAGVVERLIGVDGYDRLLDAIEAEYGSDDMEKVAEFISAALEAAGAKN